MGQEAAVENRALEKQIPQVSFKIIHDFVKLFKQR